VTVFEKEEIGGLIRNAWRVENLQEPAGKVYSFKGGMKGGFFVRYIAGFLMMVVHNSLYIRRHLAEPSKLGDACAYVSR